MGSEGDVSTIKLLSLILECITITLMQIFMWGFLNLQTALFLEKRTIIIW